MKTIVVNNVECVIQSYRKNDFVHLCPINSKLDSVRCEFGNKHTPFTTHGKETKEWKDFVKGIDISSLQEQIQARLIKP